MGGNTLSSPVDGGRVGGVPSRYCLHSLVNYEVFLHLALRFFDRSEAPRTTLGRIEAVSDHLLVHLSSPSSAFSIFVKWLFFKMRCFFDRPETSHTTSGRFEAVLDYLLVH